MIQVISHPPATISITYSAEQESELAALKPVDRTGKIVCQDSGRHNWLDDCQAPNILLLCGTPGAGKSTTASTLVSNLQCITRLVSLGSSFFCKSGHQAGDVALSDPAAFWRRTVAFDLNVILSLLREWLRIYRRGE